MADVPLVNRAVVSAPKDYTLPQAQEIFLKAVRAEIDGTGAAGSYLPALQLISDAGDVMWTAVDTGSPIAAGGTQSVSWFHGLSKSSGASTTNAHWFLANHQATFGMSAATQETIVWQTLESSDSSLFTLGTVDRPNDAVVVHREGVLVVSSYLIPSGVGTDFTVGINNNLIGFGVLGEDTNEPSVVWNRDGMTGGVSPYGPRDISVMVLSQVPQSVVSEYFNHDGILRNATAAQMAGLWWPTGTLVT